MSFTGPDELRESADNFAAMPSKSADGILYWPIALALGWPVILVLVWSAPFDFTFVAAPLVMLLWAISVVAGLVIAVTSAYRRVWLRMLSSSVLPLTGLVVGLNIADLWGLAATAGDELHVLVMRPSYLREISALPSDQSRFAIFNWGGFVVSHAVVYDESDEIALPDAQHSDAWRKRVKGTEIECGVIGFNPAGGHFYIVRLGC